jgi:hypothetical protein
MNLEYTHLLPADFHPDSRVWIYQSSRLFSLSEALEIEQMLKEFVGNWQSHGAPVKGFATMFFGRFIILMADETHTGVSGCSTDSSVRLIKEIEKRFSVNLFDRTTLAFVRNDKIELLPITQLNYAAQNGFISGDTLYFNNLVDTKQTMEENWIIPVNKSWLKGKIQDLKPVS